jgi:uncharacterized phiE125 gp8 family phage protein
MTVTIETGGPLAVPLDDLKAYLSISLDAEDLALTGLIRAASAAAERFLGQMIVVRGVEELLAPRRDWQPLAMRPARAITAVAGIDADGTPFTFPVESHAIDIDANGTGWLRLLDPGAAVRVRLAYTAGLAVDGEGVPEPISHAILRMAGELHARREGLEPRLAASVAALLRPWRRMALT